MFRRFRYSVYVSQISFHKLDNKDLRQKQRPTLVLTLRDFKVTFAINKTQLFRLN